MRQRQPCRPRRRGSAGDDSCGSRCTVGSLAVDRFLNAGRFCNSHAEPGAGDGRGRRVYRCRLFDGGLGPNGHPHDHGGPVQPVVKEPEVALDLGSDPSRPDSKEAGQTPAQPALETADGELSTVEVVRILAPSVVQIANESVAIGAFNRPIPAEGVGTGVIIDAAGHILTSSHVIEAARTITVTLSDGERYEARLVGNDPTTDVSIIAIETEGLQPARTLSPSATRSD